MKRELDSEKMVQKIETVMDLFGNSKFKVFAPYFFKEYRTELSVSNDTEISRLTILAFRKKFNKYIDRRGDSAWFPYKIKIDLLVDYFSQVLRLNEAEERILSNMVNDKNIENIIIRNNSSSDTLISKTIFILLSMDILASRETRPKLSKRSSNEGNFSEYYEMLRIFTSMGSSAADLGSQKELSEPEIENFGLSVLRFSDMKSQALVTLIKKIKQSNLPFVANPAGLSKLMFPMMNQFYWVKEVR